MIARAGSVANAVISAAPHVLNHNTETVPRLYKVARHGGRYERTLELFRHARAVAPALPRKSGIILGLGEERHELLETMRDLVELTWVYGGVDKQTAAAQDGITAATTAMEDLARATAPKDTSMSQMMIQMMGSRRGGGAQVPGETGPKRSV